MTLLVRGPLSELLDFVRRDRLSGAGAILLATLVLLCLFGPWLPLGDPEEIGIGPRLSVPASGWLLGTDELGRSVLPRIVDGLRSTFLLAGTAVVLTGLFGTLIGLVAAYAGGFVDMTIMRLVDILFAFPPLLLGILIAAALGPGGTSAILAIALITLPLFVRVVRAVALSVAARSYVIAAEVSGAGFLRVILVHLLPNVLGAVIIQLTYALSIGMLVESELSFLGLGVQPPDASLGSLLRLGSVYLTIAPWLVFPAGLLLATAILSVNLLGDGLRDMIDPLRGRPLR
ncbi:MAG: ABC transporter permease [bacterium]|nr:ABC transporter permease [bacterium]